MAFKNLFRRIGIVLLMLFVALGYNMIYAREESNPSELFTPIGETDDWFEVDGIQYHIINGGTECEVGSYTGDGSCGMHTYSRMRHIYIPVTVTHNDITYTVVGVEYMGLMTDLITLTLPEGMKYLQGASQSNRLERLEIPEGMEHISSVAYFPRLRELTLPSNPVKIESSFDKCPSLERVTVNATEPYEMDESSFKGSNLQFRHW